MSQCTGVNSYKVSCHCWRLHNARQWRTTLHNGVSYGPLNQLSVRLHVYFLSSHSSHNAPHTAVTKLGIAPVTLSLIPGPMCWTVPLHKRDCASPPLCKRCSLVIMMMLATVSSCQQCEGLVRAVERILVFFFTTCGLMESSWCCSGLASKKSCDNKTIVRCLKHCTNYCCYVTLYSQDN